MQQGILKRLALPGVSGLISFLAYGSQALFRRIEPGPLHGVENYAFNILIGSIWIAYARACFVDPGWIPKDWDPLDDVTSKVNGSSDDRQGWCRKCEAYKPQRAHHCKICARCIPKMDHHCPWTGNCVSYRTMPHFSRFLLYCVVSMTYLEYFLAVRAVYIWDRRAEPSYLGPSVTQLASLFVLLLTNGMTLLLLTILIAKNVWSLGANVTTIESWEIERHETLVRRAKRRGGYLDGPNGSRIRLTKQEFPYDIGIWSNLRQGLGSSPLLWFWPFISTPDNASGLSFETNGFDDRPWPPPDPDRVAHRTLHMADAGAFSHGDESTEEWVAGFKQRQQADLRHRHNRDEDVAMRQTWKNKEGETLEDFGVDDEADAIDDSVPLGTLLQRRKLATRATTED